MHVSDYDYALPPELIAGEPVRPRDASRMMVVDRKTGALEDSAFRILPERLQAGDVLVINDTRVLKARVIGRLERPSGAVREIEVLFANPAGTPISDAWDVLCRPGKRIRPGDHVVFAAETIGTFANKNADGSWVLSVRGETIPDLLERCGHVPLPPYMQRPDRPADADEYQTLFARDAGAVAAPTAGLHFTKEVVADLERKGVEIVTITLHVGVGTFMPVRTNDPHDHQLKAEWFRITDDAARRLNAAREEQRRVIAVGTTSTRTLEYVVGRNGRVVAGSGYADAYILPGYRFCAIDGLLTNFHLPRSTLLMLVSAFASPEMIRKAYAHAIEQRYRFYSYGDCMLIL